MEHARTRPNTAGGLRPWPWLFAILLALAGCPTADDDDSGGDDDTSADDDTGDDDTGDDDTGSDFSLASMLFDEAAPIPVEFTCDNPKHDQGISPQLYWENAPENTAYFALTLFDPDANDTPHWGLFDIPADTESLIVGVSPTGTLPGGSWEAIVYTGEAEYAGPCPPQPHDPHTYVFTIHALDASMPDYFTTPNLEDMENDIQDRLLTSAILTGTYDRE